MDKWNGDVFPQTVTASLPAFASHLPPSALPSERLRNLSSDFRPQTEAEVKDTVAARKIQKADREKLRRDKLNEHFLELGKALDPDRPKNDKATILTDTIQVLKDLTAEVTRLKAEYSALSEESREVTQEKNELREEKASLRSDIDNLKIQNQQRLGVMFPWTTMDASSVLMTPPYSLAFPVPVRPTPVPLDPSLQPCPFFGIQSPGSIPNPCSTFVAYPALARFPAEQPSPHYTSASHVSSKQDRESKSSERGCCSSTVKCDDSNDVATELALKMPGSISQQVLPSEKGELKQLQEEISITNGCSNSKHSASQDLQDSSSASVGDD